MIDVVVLKTKTLDQSKNVSDADPQRGHTLFRETPKTFSFEEDILKSRWECS
jgi:hypothetical protein